MNTILLRPYFKTSKRARILPIDSLSSHLQRQKPVLKRPEGTCELNTVLHDVLEHYTHRFSNKFVSPISEGTFVVRISDSVLQRVIGLIFEGMGSAGLWGDGETACITPIVCKCLDGYGALLELTDQTVPLSATLLTHMSQPGTVVRARELPGHQLITARDLIQRHGGRLIARSPLWEEKTGTAIQLYLPLAASAIRHTPAASNR